MDVITPILSLFSILSITIDIHIEMKNDTETNPCRDLYASSYTPINCKNIDVINMAIHVIFVLFLRNIIEYIDNNSPPIAKPKLYIGADLDLIQCPRSLKAFLLHENHGEKLIEANIHEYIMRKVIKTNIPNSADEMKDLLEVTDLPILLAGGCTAVLQLFASTSTFFLGMGLGIEASIWYFWLYVPLAFLIGSIPVSMFWGLGLMEGAYVLFFAGSGFATVTQAAMLAMGARLIQLLWSLPGSVAVIHGFPKEGNDNQKPPDGVGGIPMTQSWGFGGFGGAPRCAKGHSGIPSRTGTTPHNEALY